MSFPATVDSLFYTCLLINTDQESSSEPMSSEKDMAIAELPDVCAVVEVATENEEPEDQHTEVSLPLQDSHVSSYSGNVLSCLYLYCLLCCIHHRSHKLLITLLTSSWWILFCTIQRVTQRAHAATKT